MSQPPGPYGGPPPGPYGGPPPGQGWGQPWGPPPPPPLPRPAGLGERLVARLLDNLVVAVPSLVLGGVAGLLLVLRDPMQPLVVPGWVTALSALVSVAVGLIYFAVLDTRYAGRTVGKRVMGLAVGGPRGGNLTLGESLRRNAFLLLGVVNLLPFGQFLVWPLLLVAYLTLMITVHTDPRHQGWHDRLAGGTQVWKVRSSAGPPQ